MEQISNFANVYKKPLWSLTTYRFMIIKLLYGAVLKDILRS
jgi:hypothetical protein